MAGPWEKYQQQGGNVHTVTDPAEERRAANEAERIEIARRAAIRAEEAADRSAEAANKPPAGYVWGPAGPDGTPTMLAIPGGPADKQNKPAQALRQGDSDKLRNAANIFTSFTQARDGFKADYGGNLLGGLENTAQGFFDTGTPGQRDWWSSVYDIDNIIRNDLFGASLTAGEKQAYERTTISPGMSRKQIEMNLERREQIMGGALRRYVNGLKAGGWNSNEIDALVGEVAQRMQPGGEKRENQRDDPTAALAAQAPPPVGGGLSSPTGPQGFDPSRVYNQDSAPPLAPASGALLGPAKRKEYDYDVAKQVDALIRSGASDEAIDGYVRQRGYPGYQGLNEVREYLRKNPGYKGGLVNPPVKAVDQSALERFSQGAPGAALISAGNMGSFGGVQALNPEQYAMSEEAHPFANIAGSIPGAITGTGLVGRIGGNITRKVAPTLLKDFRGAQFGRNLAADAGYGAVYGGVTEGDPLSGMVYAAGGSAFGQTVGGTAGRMLRGARPTSEAQTLANRGVEGLTVGQKLGGEWKAIEDRMAGLPIVGTQVRNRMTEGYDSFNRAALNEAGAPVGATVTDTGERGLYQLLDNPETGTQGAIGQAYDAATAGVNVPLDLRFSADIASARAAGSALPPDYLPKFDKAMTNRIGPIEQAGGMTGDQFQQAMRGLKGYRSGAAGSAPGFEIDWKAALTQAQNALRSQMERGGGADVVSGLSKANEAYLLAKTIQSAQSAAKGGSSTGELRLFSPSQLLNASEKTASKYPGPRPFAELADAAQKTLPSKIPDSGSAGRIAQIALGGTAIGGAGGGFAGGYEGATAGGVGGAATPLAILGLLALGASKKGQKGFDKLLFDRSGPLGKYAGSAGRGLAKGQKKGLFGSATVPFLLEAQNQ